MLEADQASTSSRDKKRLLRAAIERVVITSTEDSIKVAVEWKGGETTEEEFARRRRGEPTLVTDADVVELVRRLAAQGLDDTQQIARVLSRRGMRTATGLTFTKRRVQSVRACYEIPCGSARSSSPHESLYTVEDAARELGLSSRTIHEWLRAGLLRGQKPMPAAGLQRKRGCFSATAAMRSQLRLLLSISLRAGVGVFPSLR